MKIIQPTKMLDARFAFHFLQTVRLPDDVGYSRHYKFLKRIFVPVPPRIDEQRRIAAILDKADAIRRKRRQALAETEALLRATFLDMFGDPVRNERRHPVQPLQKLIDLSRPITYGILMPGPDQANGVPYVRVVDIQDGLVLFDQVRRTTPAIAHEYRRSRLKPGDLLISIRGHVGRTALVPHELDGANITQDTARLAFGRPADAAYVEGCLGTSSLQGLMARLTKGGAVKGINLGDLKELPIPVPPLALREEFALLVIVWDRLTAALRLNIADAQQLFGSLSQRAFRGDL